MKPSLTSLFLAGTAILAAGSAIAQQAGVPDFLERTGEYRYEGQVAGMDSYTLEGADGLFFVAPDGKTVIAGTAFTATGRDIGAAMIGTTPIRVFEPGWVERTRAQPAAPKASGDVLTGQELEEMEAGVSRIEEQVATRGASQDEPGPDVQEMQRDVDAALDGLSQKDVDVMKLALREMLQDADVKNDIQFRSVIDTWTQEVVRRYRDKNGLTPTELPDSTGSDVTRDGSEQAATLIESANDVPTDKIEVLSEISPAESLLEEFRKSAFWFSIGKSGAPVVYAFIDPTCPYCAKAIDALDEAIGGGDIELRVALVAVVSDRAPGYIESILSSESPPDAFIDHEVGKSSGRSPLDPGDWESLHPAYQEGVIRNANLMKKYGVSGVPFFVYETEEGAGHFNGVPGVDEFSEAIPDNYTGDQ